MPLWNIVFFVVLVFLVLFFLVFLVLFFGFMGIVFCFIFRNGFTGSDMSCLMPVLSCLVRVHYC